ncbi:hypothetical protein [Salinigranum salinum]|uniref:hypothetical protein n=1 Tax=Salinigranum salinum TaxID=1364937 RepID=UPI001260A45F|nr:hypothetical protein [Salinigranum salinum]
MADTDHTELVDRLNLDAELLVVVALVGVTVLVDTVGRWALAAVGGTSLQPLALLIVLATVAVGATARWGLVVGLLVAGLVLGDWTGGVVHAFAALTAVVVCQRVWATREGYRWLGRYVAAAVSTTLALAAAAAWLSELLGVAPFSVAVVPSVVENLVPALLGAPAAWILSDVGRDRGWRVETEALSTRETALMFGVLAVWVGGGYLGSFVYRAAGTVPVAVFGQRLGRTAEWVIVLGGPQGRYAVLVFGVAAMLALAVTLQYDR